MLRKARPCGVCEDSSRLVREKTRARPLQSSRALTTLAVSSWESEELDERSHALFLTAARKALGSGELGDAVKARPKQFPIELPTSSPAPETTPGVGKTRIATPEE